MIFCTSYCNKGHRMRDGKPFEHECYILPPFVLELEQKGRIEEAIHHLSLKMSELKRHRGIGEKKNKK